MSEWLSLELDDDPATLQAALAMIDALEDNGSITDSGGGASLAAVWQHASSHPRSTSSNTKGEDTTDDALTSSNSDASEQPSPRTDDTEKDHGMPFKRRRNRREEILHLRDTVSQLERSLAARQKKQRLAADGVTSGVDHERDAGNTLTVSAVWENISRRQQSQRRESEQENARLRKMLETQASVGSRLMRLVSESQHQQGYDTMRKIPRRVMIDASHRMSEKQLISRMGELYNQVEDVFAAPRFCTGPLVFRDIRASDDGDGGTKIDANASWVVPYPVRDVRQAMWKLTSRPSGSPTCPVKNPRIVLLDDMVITTIKASACDNNPDATAELSGQLVTKRFHEDGDDNGLVVSSLYGEVTGSIGGTTHELMILREESWIRVREVMAPIDGKPGDSTARVPVAQVQATRRVTLHFDAEHSTDRQRTVSILTELVLTQVEDMLTSRQQLLENLMLGAQSY